MNDQIEIRPGTVSLDPDHTSCASGRTLITCKACAGHQARYANNPPPHLPTPPIPKQRLPQERPTYTYITSLGLNTTVPNAKATA